MAPTTPRGVFLCRCNGRVTSRLPLEEIRTWLQELDPGLTVAVADDLCQPDAVSRLAREYQVQPAVIAGCAHLKSEMGFWQDPEKSPFDPESVGTVDLVHEAVSPYDDAELVQRAKLLLWAQARRQEKAVTVPSTARRAHFMRAHGEISRRDLFQALVPKYRVTPYIEPALCLGEKCRICRSGCDSRAIASEAGTVSIDAASCKGCGVCTTLCPRQAIIYPGFSLDQMEAEIGGLMLDRVQGLRPRTIAFVCQSSQPPALDVNVLPVRVPCLGAISPGLLLRALEKGAQGILLISSKRRCQMKLDCSNWVGTSRFVQRLLEHWGLEPERVIAFDEDDLDRQLPLFSRRMAQLAPTAFTSSQSTAFPDKALGLPAAILAMSEKLGAGVTGRIAAGTVPFGQIVLDATRCTGCGVCAANCPTEALADLKLTDTCRLVFRQESCVGCGQCADVCPEKCLHLTRVLDVSQLAHEPRMIFEGEFFHCRVCGAPFAPKAMVESVRARLGTTGQGALRLETCPKCRMKGKVRPTKSSAGV